MAKEHAQAVRKSDLYEYKGISKSLLERIAFLIVGARKEDERGKTIGEPKPNEGYCTASQQVLAAMHGCSEREVGRQVQKFVRDGWLSIEEYRNEAGHRHYKYFMTAKQLKAIQARAMKKYPDDHEKAGYYIRAKSAKMRRDFKTVGGKTDGGVTTNGAGGKPHDRLSGSLPTTSREALTTACAKPHDNESMNGLGTGVVLPSLIEEKMGCSGKTPEKSKPSDSLFQGKKEEPTPTPGAQDNTSPAGAKTRRGARPAPPPVELLEPRVVEKMVKLGFPAPVIAQIQKMKFWSEALNNTSNVLSSYESLCNNPNDFADRMFKMWMPKRILTAGGMGDDCYDQGWEESLAAKAAVPKEVRIQEEAISWFCSLCTDEKRHQICEFSKTHWEAIKVEENKKLIAAAYLIYLEDRRREEHEDMMKKCRESAAKKAALEQERATHQAYLDKAAPRAKAAPARDYLDEVEA